MNIVREWILFVKVKLRYFMLLSVVCIAVIGLVILFIKKEDVSTNYSLVEHGDNKSIEEDQDKDVKVSKCEYDNMGVPNNYCGVNLVESSIETTDGVFVDKHPELKWDKPFTVEYVEPQLESEVLMTSGILMNNWSNAPYVNIYLDDLGIERKFDIDNTFSFEVASYYMVDNELQHESRLLANDIELTQNQRVRVVFEKDKIDEVNLRLLRLIIN